METGTHKELLNGETLYKSMWEKQSLSLDSL